MRFIMCFLKFNALSEHDILCEHAKWYKKRFNVLFNWQKKRNGAYLAMPLFFLKTKT